MSSAMAFDPQAGTKILSAAEQKEAQKGNDSLGRGTPFGMSRRQQLLNAWWSLYMGQQYDACKFDWDGSARSTDIGNDAVASGTSVPPGFYDAGGGMMPLKFRRPSSPYGLGHVIVNRFTGMLFSRRHHPKPSVEGDPDTEDFVSALCETSRIWAKMILARKLGGAQGTVAIGFKFVDGVPVIEPHDARWCDPTFKDRDRLILERVEIRYQYNEDWRNPDTNEFETVRFWSRRVIDEFRDTTFLPVVVDERNREPDWKVDQSVQHGLGFCPVVWVQNRENLDSIDGLPDLFYCDETLRAIDKLLAQAEAGVIANADPTFWIATDQATPPDLTKGSGNGIKMKADGKVGYLELQGAGAEAAVKLSDRRRKHVLEVSRCVLDNPEEGGGAMTATEVLLNHAPMIEATEELQEQYGERGVKPLLEMMVKAARALAQPRMVDGQPVAFALNLPPRYQKDAADPTKVVAAARKLGPGGNLNLMWPDLYGISPEDSAKIVDMSGKAKLSGLVDVEHAAKKVAAIFGVEDVPAMLKGIQDDAVKQQADLERLALAQVPGPAITAMAKSGTVARTDDSGAPEGGQDATPPARQTPGAFGRPDRPAGAPARPQLVPHPPPRKPAAGEE